MVQTKLILIDDKVTQPSGGTLNLSGTTFIDNANISNFKITSPPQSGDSNSFVLVRDDATGIIKGVPQSGITSPAGTNTHVQFNNQNSFGSSAYFRFSGGSQSLTVGSRSGAFSEGCRSLSVGYNASAIGKYSVSIGKTSSSCALGSVSIGSYVIANGINSMVVGNDSVSNGNNSLAVGAQVDTFGCASVAFGIGISSCQQGSFGSGRGTSSRPIISNGIGSFNHSLNSGDQIIDHGVNAYASAILGGRNHNIESGNTGATIIGGDTIKLTGTTYLNTTAVDNLAVISTPSNGTSEDSVLVRDASNGIIKVVDQSTFGSGSSGGGSSPEVRNVKQLNSVSGSTSINFEDVGGDQKFSLTLDENTTFTYSGETNRDSYGIYIISTGSTGTSRTITFPSTIIMPDSTNNIPDVTWDKDTYILSLPVGYFRLGGDFSGTHDWVMISDKFSLPV